MELILLLCLALVTVTGFIIAITVGTRSLVLANRAQNYNDPIRLPALRQLYKDQNPVWWRRRISDVIARAKAEGYGALAIGVFILCIGSLILTTDPSVKFYWQYYFHNELSGVSFYYDTPAHCSGECLNSSVQYPSFPSGNL